MSENFVSDAVGALAMAFLDRTLKSGKSVTIPSLGIVIEGDNVSEMQMIDGNSILDVPTDVATCPYCGAAVTASFTAWTVDDDDRWIAAEVSVDCTSEPDIDSNDWRQWFQQHSYMPYVYQLPVDTKVLEWVNQHYRFNDCKP